VLPNSGKEASSVIKDSAVGMVTRPLAVWSKNALSTSYRDNKYFSSLNHPDGLWGPHSLKFSGEQGHFTRNTKMTVISIYLQGKCVELYLHSPIHFNCMVLRYNNSFSFEEHTKRKIKKREEGDVRVTKFITWNVTEIIRVLKVSRWCPLVLMVNAC
jgi:hypothetical protein